MNDLEFREQYKRLKEVHPNTYENNEKALTVWRFVKDMEIDWFKSLVDRVVLSNRGDKIDIGEAVASERRHRASIKFADDVIETLRLRNNISDNGLENVLKRYEFESLIDCLYQNDKKNT